ncbi:CCD33 protein, partial [Neopipo cinnamomea]|nr:CCD33 protein [Neopipo cinnamomea]
AGEPHIPLTLQRSRLKAEEKTLDFEFEVVSAQFNRRGCYALRLTVENPLLQGSGAGIQLRVNGGNATQSSTSTTDTIEQSHLNQIYSFQRRKFTFTLPRGFCKNDKNHDVRLHIEALRFSRRAERLRRGRQVGEAFFAIYPRPDQPRLKLSARRNEDWYRYSAVVALLRVGSEQPAMHCGRLAFTVSLHEHREPTTPAAPPPRPPSSQEDQQAAGTAPASPDLGISPHSLRTPESAYHSLPAEGHAHFPEVGEPRFWGRRSNRAGRNPGRAPTSKPQLEPSQPWGSACSSFDSSWAGSGFHPFCVLSQGSGSCHQAHRKSSVVPAITHLSLSQGFCHMLIFPGNPAWRQGTARVFGRGCSPSQSGETPGWLTMVTNVQLSSFSICVPQGCHSREGMRLLFLARRKPRQPLAPGPWAGPGYPPPARLKAEDGHGAAISTTTGTELPLSPPSHLRDPLSAQNSPCNFLLVFHSSSPSLQWHIEDVDGGRGDMQWMQISPDAPSLPLSPHPSIPQTIASPSPETSSIPDPVRRRCPPQPGPCHTQHPREQRGATGNPPVPTSWPGNFISPASPGIIFLLFFTPCLLLKTCKGQKAQSLGMTPRSSTAPPHILGRFPQGGCRKRWGNGGGEVGSYRLALKRMAGDLLSLRRHVTSLEVENGHLRSNLASQQELGHALLHDADLDVMTREELLDRLATLKHKLVASTAEMRRLKDRVQQLQNELIRKNDQEKELVLLQRAHRLQQAMLRRCQDKVAKAKGLEETVQQQEKVIEVMERVLQEKLAGTGRSTEKPAGHVPVSPPPHPPGEALSGEVHTALLAENRRLREELARAAHPSAPIAPRPPALPGVLGGTEKLSLLARLEEAQARGRVLERQLENAARKWGREKQQLGTRLLEQENGF